MNRREALTALGTVGVAGCLRLDDGSGDAEARESGGDGSGDGNPFYTDEASAREYVASFAADQAPAPGTYGGDGPERIAFATRSGGTSASGIERDGVVSAADVDVVTTGDEDVRFGPGRSLRVRNLATGSALRFDPASDVESRTADRIKVDVRGDGELRERAPTLYPPDESDTVDLDGTWTGDEELFQHQTFARCVVELLADGSVVATTGGRILGIGYRWGIEQSRSTAFVTRQPGVRESWYAEFRLGGTVFEPADAVVPEAHPDKGVFKVDLTELDVDPDEYDWRLRISDEEGGETHDRYIELSSSFGNTVFVD